MVSSFSLLVCYFVIWRVFAISFRTHTHLTWNDRWCLIYPHSTFFQLDTHAWQFCPIWSHISKRSFISRNDVTPDMNGRLWILPLFLYRSPPEYNESSRRCPQGMRSYQTQREITKKEQIFWCTKRERAKRGKLCFFFLYDHRQRFSD